MTFEDLVKAIAGIGAAVIGFLAVTVRSLDVRRIEAIEKTQSEQRKDLKDLREKLYTEMTGLRGDVNKAVQAMQEQQR